MENANVPVTSLKRKLDSDNQDSSSTSGNLVDENLHPNATASEVDSLSSENRALNLQAVPNKLTIEELDRLFQKKLRHMSLYCRMIDKTYSFLPNSAHERLFYQQQREQERRRASLSTCSRPYFKNHLPALVSTANVLNCCDLLTDFINAFSTTETAPSAEEECVICQSAYKQTDRVRVLKCSHKFHKPCVDKWFAQSDLCPVCRECFYESCRKFKRYYLLANGSSPFDI